MGATTSKGEKRGGCTGDEDVSTLDVAVNLLDAVEVGETLETLTRDKRNFCFTYVQKRRGGVFR